MDYTYNNQIKKTVRELVFDNLPRGHITTLVGPELQLNLRYIERYIFRIINGHPSKINLYEYDKSIYHDLLEDFINLLQDNKNPFARELLDSVTIVNDDIVHAEPQKIMDLDFCTSFKNNQETVDKLLKKQYNISFKGKPGNKAFTITCSERDPKDGSFATFTEWYSSIFGGYRTDKMLQEFNKEGMRLGGKMDMVTNQPNLYATSYSWDSPNNYAYGNTVNINIETQKEFIIKYNAGGGPMFVWFILYMNSGTSS